MGSLSAHGGRVSAHAEATDGVVLKICHDDGGVHGYLFYHRLGQCLSHLAPDELRVSVAGICVAAWYARGEIGSRCRSEVWGL